ncbi:MAG: nitroreductase family protein [Methanobrevibacter sp.]|uniref:nitroreductase family protein n=1 Tax=Methanobrevibacter sp. TaxID=66852 RepID=UPI001B095EB2|nr:nitroreductase family protein [Methanobrevibacter sp.]
MKNNLLDLTLKRRSIRNYLNEEIDDEIIQEILNVALTAPSSWGGHPVHFIVVKDKNMIQKIAHCKAMGAAPLTKAKVCIVVMADTSRCELWIEDASVASTYILLAAEQFDIGACWIHIRNRDGQIKTADEEIRDLLNVPNSFRVLNCVALGKKGEFKNEYLKENLSFENIHYEHY